MDGEGSKIEYTVTKSSNEEMMKAGEVVVDVVLEITDALFKYKDEDGEVFIETRKK